MAKIARTPLSCPFPFGQNFGQNKKVKLYIVAETVGYVAAGLSRVQMKSEVVVLEISRD